MNPGITCTGEPACDADCEPGHGHALHCAASASNDEVVVKFTVEVAVRYGREDYHDRDLTGALLAEGFASAGQHYLELTPDDVAVAYSTTVTEEP